MKAEIKLLTYFILLFCSDRIGVAQVRNKAGATFAAGRANIVVFDDIRIFGLQGELMRIESSGKHPKLAAQFFYTSFQVHISNNMIDLQTSIFDSLLNSISKPSLISSKIEEDSEASDTSVRICTILYTDNGNMRFRTLYAPYGEFRLFYLEGDMVQIHALLAESDIGEQANAAWLRMAKHNIPPNYILNHGFGKGFGIGP